MAPDVTIAKSAVSESSTLHPRNPHRGRYDFTALIKAQPELASFVIITPAGQQSIDFSDATAVKVLNQALLAHHYKVKFWQLPEGYLCPPVPGRADYVHYLADLLDDGDVNAAQNSTAKSAIRLLDIGTGANCIYPIIASQTYGWQVTASDIDPVAVRAAKLIAESNPVMKKRVKVVLQTKPEQCFTGVIMPDQYFDLTMCNPPFYRSAAEAAAVSSRKWQKLGKQASGRNFAGQPHELFCDGGELAFISNMINESRDFRTQVNWFSSLVSQSSHLPELKALLRTVQAARVQVIAMRQGQKTSHILAWSFKSLGIK